MNIRKNIIITLSVIVFFGGLSKISAGTVEQLDGSLDTGLNAGEIHGQSFTATATEDLVSIEVASDEPGTVTLRIHSGETPCESGFNVPNPANLLSTTAGIAIADTNPVNGADVSTFFSTLTPSAPIPMTIGQQYTFCFQITAGSLQLTYNNANLYAGGRMYYGLLSGFQAVDDFSFRVNVSTSAQAPISSFALLALFASLGLIGFFGKRKYS